MCVVLKRDGRNVDFDPDRVKNAVIKAFDSTKVFSNEEADKESERITGIISNYAKKQEKISVEDIQDKVENLLMGSRYKQVAKNYILFREERNIARGNSTDKTVSEMLEGKNEYWLKENSNKNPIIVTTQRDYLAGVESTDLTRRRLLPRHIVKAHDEGLIHFHDADYFAQLALNNCCLVNLDDMLQNGTVVNGVMIEKPKKCITASTIATQIILGVSSSQYGGCTISLTHLAPFVRDSFLIYLKDATEFIARGDSVLDKILNKEVWCGFDFIKDNYPKVYDYAIKMLKREVDASVQTFNYQVNSMTNSNGQAPFLSVNMYLGETDEYKEELAMLIEEFLKQRIKGFKNEKGVWVTPAFPKLLYVLEEDNIHEDSKYWYLTELAAKCTAKRMVPDYISEKKMKEYKDGNCYPCMGAARGDETVSIKVNNNEYFDICIEGAFNIIRDVIRTQNHNNPYKPALSDFKGVCGVYKLTHIPTGLFYIGSSKNIARRLMEHRYSMSHKGTLGDRYFIGDFDVDNLAYELLEECDIDDMYVTESKYVNFKNKDSMCVNQKDPINNGNFTSENRLIALAGKKYSTFENGWSGTWVKYLKDNSGIFILSNGEWVPIRAIMMNNVDCPLRMYEISYKKFDRIYTLNVTEDHPFEIYGKGRIETRDLVVGDNLIDVRNHDTYEIVGIRVTDEKCVTYDFTVDNDMFDLSGIMSHNCRSFLTVPRFTENLSNAKNYVEGKSQFYGRFNIGVVTINLIDIALSARKEAEERLGIAFDDTERFEEVVEIFYRIFEERTEICHEALRKRYERMAKITSDAAPLLWQYGAFARLGKGESIVKLLENGYATLSLGYAGLYECTKAMTGHSHTDEVGKVFALNVMQKLNDKTSKWKSAENIDYSLYGTPIESTTYKFAKCLKNRFGVIDGITDRDYITNSYHVPVFEEIDAFTKLSLESEFQRLSPGGAISYVEVPNMTKNIPAVLELIKFIYDNIMYAELNTKSDYCQKCGFDGEIEIVGERDHLYWKCPNCGNTDEKTLNVARRTCGYIGTQFWNQGRTQEIKDRVLHVD